MVDPTRTKTLREEFARVLRKLPDNVRKRVEEILLTAHRIDESTIERIKQVVEEEMGPQAVERIIDRYTWLFWQRGAEFAARQLKKFGIELLIPPTLSIIDEETVNQLKNLQLDLIKGLSDEVRKKLAFQIRDGLLKGETIRELTKRVQEVTDKTKYDAERIAKTEATRVFNQAALDRYKRAGVRYYKYLAAMDRRTCPRCAKNYNKIFKIDDPSAPRPPCHPNCRCCVVPVIKFSDQEKRSISRESKELALQHYAKVVSRTPKGKTVPDEENVRKVIQVLRKDERFQQLAEMLKQDVKELAEKKAREALQLLRENFTKHGIDRAVELEKHEITVADILRLKKRGKRYMDDVGDTHVLGKIGDKHVWIVLNEKDQVKTVHKINKRKFEKYQEKFKELKK
ncbi:minor capsid protein [Archaeoglobus profundus]|uniref:Phage head morphogenesis protein, SPP1 gp7 family n=1 Tax=Archaeoglobus profundus (strain DSM 5631 / JCM 9629 / NBRC 100127 / Av18) TaxID=572546 RepID=D2REK9_ARCPA|nr:minor capsid protein [Archaeoglobus profundus]ADB58553.1 phage head morphogenesis protein, SPP1 gp7 family [Archaeoglobus profundus DSM 5631]